MKFFVVTALLASACAEPEAEAWGGYGYNRLAGLGYSRAYSTVLARPVATYGLSPALTGYGGYSTGLKGLWKREAEADSEAEAWGTYGYSGIAGLGYGAYGGAYTTAAIARPIATTAIVRPVAATRTITRPIGVRTYGYTTGLTGYGAGLRGLWKRDAEADSEAEAWNTYGYSGLAGLGYGYGGAYTTAAIARPIATAIVRPAATYGYSTGLAGYGYGAGLRPRGLWKRDAEADSEAEAWNTYGYAGLAGLGYGYGGYTAAIARPVASTAIVRPVAATRTITRPIGVRTYGYTTGLTGYGAGLRGLWKRDAEAESDPEAWYGNYGYGLTGLGYGGVYTTASIARPVYGYSGRYLW